MVESQKVRYSKGASDDTVELLITHSLIWEFKGLFNSKFPNSIMHYEQFDCNLTANPSLGVGLARVGDALSFDP